jgi:peptide/nickel transport system substrate-binding protein
MSHPASVLTGQYASVSSVTALGPHTVMFRLKVRDSTFTSNPRVLSPTQLAKVGDGFGSSPVCVGPFMFDDRVVGDRITVIKSPYYYNQKDVFLDKVVYKRLSSQEAGAAALKAGDIDVLDSVATTELPGVRQNTNLRVLEAPQLNWTSLFVNIGNTHGAGNLPYGNVGTDLSSSPTLRQAFEEALDRKTLVRVVFDGLYQPNCTLVASANRTWYEATKLPCTPYAPKHARKLVAESGIANPTVHLLTSTATTSVRLAQAIEAQVEAVGIDVVLEATDPATWRTRGVSGDFDVLLFGLVSDNVGDPHDAIYRFFVSSQTSNRSGYSNPRLDLILNNAAKATDPKARATLYRLAQQIIANDRPMIVLYNVTLFVGVTARVTGVRLASNGDVLVMNARFR